MAFDGLVLSAVAEECNQLLAGGRIDKIQQPTAEDIVLLVRAGRINHRLLLSCNRTYPRAHITTRFSAPSPATAPMFAMLLRKHLEGGHIARIHQFKRERILYIDVEAWDELGDRIVRRIVVEIMGKHSNIMLLDRPDGIILDAASHISRAVNRHREILPGRPYVFPPFQDKLDPFIETEKGFILKRENSPDVLLRKFLIQTYLGISPFFGLEAEYILQSEQMPSAHREWRVFADLTQRAKEVECPVLIADTEGHTQDFYVFPPQHLPGKQVILPSVNECIDQFYTERAITDIARSKLGSFLRLVTTQRDKDLQKISKFQTLLDSHLDAEQWRINGELLTAYQHMAQKGQSQIVLPNFYDDDQPLHIDLDPSKTALENAQSYFKKYNKYKKGLEVTQEQLLHAQTDATYWDSVLHEMDSCRLEDLPAIESELRESGLIRAIQPTASKRTTSKAKKTKPTMEKSNISTFTATDGTLIRVGRNNRENDLLTFKLARKSDTWLHVKDAPGSHVVVQGGEDVSQETLYEAALLAAHFSRLRTSAKVAVDVVPLRNVWKPNGAKPGFALFEGQQTLIVTLDQEQLQRIVCQVRQT